MVVTTKAQNFRSHQYMKHKNLLTIATLFMTYQHVIVVRGLYSSSIVAKQLHVFARRFQFYPRYNSVSAVTGNIADHTNPNQLKEETHLTKEHFVTDERHKKWLVVGDGDLSYSTSIARSLHRSSNLQLIASVLESADEHSRIYRHSEKNIRSITETSSRVLFEIDATRLERHFQPNSLDRIIFNFPHWIGKSNNRYNRQLLRDFFKSASHVSNRNDNGSEIHVALCHRQGGADATTLTEWKQSWMIHSIAAEHGFMLQRLEPFVIDYNLSSHRGVDRPFHVGETTLKYVFGWPIQGVEVPVNLRIAYRFELRLLLIPDVLTLAGLTCEQIQHDDTILNLAQELLPDGIACHVPMRNLIPAADFTNQQWPLLIYLVVYSGKQIPMSRESANKHRIRLEETVENRLGKGLLLRKGDRMVSNPFPYHFLSMLIDERSN